MSGQDSIILSYSDTIASVAFTPEKEVFEGSELAGGIIPLEGGIQALERLQELPPVWLFVCLFVLIGFLAWMRVFYGNVLLETFQAATNFQVASRIFKDNSMLQNQLDRILYLFYFLSTAFLLYYLETETGRFPYELEGGLLYMFNLALLAGVFLGRTVIVNLAGFIFNRIRLFREYLYNSFLFNKLIGIAAVPLLLFLWYTSGALRQVFFWLAVAVLVSVLMMRLFRSLVFSFKKGVSVFYMFLYLCALEIIPLALLYRWLEGIL